MKIFCKIFSFRQEKGFTLVEVIVAMFIIALVILGGGMFFIYGRVNIIREAHRRAAVLVASERLEALKAAEFSDIALESSSPYGIIWSSGWSIVGAGTPESVQVDNLGDADMVTNAQYIDEDTDGDYDYLEITVRVEWTDSTNNTVSATTLIAPRG